MTLDLSSLLLLSYVTAETIRTNYAYHVFHNYPSLSASTINTFSELLKLSAAIVALLWPTSSPNDPAVPVVTKIREFAIWMRMRGIGYALPAALYLVNNLIYMTVLPYTSPSLLQVCVLAKLPATGILHHFMIRRQQNMYAWYSLFMLCVGLVIFNLPSGSLNQASIGLWYLAPISGVVIAALSAVASISSERLIKDGDFWTSQTGLYAWGTVFSIILIPVMSVFGPGKVVRSDDLVKAPGNSFMAATMLVCITAGSGLVVATLLRYKDNILKMIGTSASLVTVAISQFILVPELRASNFTPLKVCGASIVAVCTWCYNHWNQKPWPPVTGYISVDTERGEAKPMNGSSEKDDFKLAPAPNASMFEPNARKVTSCAVVIALVTLAMSMQT